MNQGIRKRYAAVALLLSACAQNATSVSAEDRVASVSLQFAEGSPKAQGLGPGNPASRLRFEARDAHGQLITNVAPTYVSSDSTAVAVTSDGQVLALKAPGGAIVSAYIRTKARVFADTVRVTMAVAL
jgi:hypothetical protein